MVRLKDDNGYVAKIAVHPFQFHYGTIKSVNCRRRTRSLPYFNSTMVRLKVEENPDILAQLKFQFHYGTIKRLQPNIQDFGKTNFNSTMVRLKDSGIQEP